MRGYNCIKDETIRVIIILIFLVTIMAFFPSASLAEYESDNFISLAESKTITYAYTGFTYNDEMLLVNANALSTDLAKASVVLSAAAYGNSNTAIVDLLNQMGYSYRSGNQSYQYNKTVDDNDIVGYTIASRDLDENRRAYCVPIRGTNNSEWFSDFNIGENNNGRHIGFYTAMQIVKNDLISIIRNDGKESIIWITGHSRGAAVANILAGELTRNNIVSSSQLFCYTFACPAVSKNTVAYDNIYNFNNKGDLITQVPLAEWNYSRYGHDIEMNLRPMDNVTTKFANLMGHSFGSASSCDEYISLLMKLVPSESSAQLPVQRAVFQYVAYCMDLNGGGADVSWLDFRRNLVIEMADGVWSLIQQSGCRIGNIVSGLVNFREDNSEVYTFIDENADAIASMSEADFSVFVSNNRTMINSMESLSGIAIQGLETYRRCTDVCYNAIATAKSFGEALSKIIGLYFDTQGNLLTSVADGHTTETYVLWINSMFCGYKGWYESGANSVNFEYYTGYGARVTSVGYQCFYECKFLDCDIPNDIMYIGNSAFYSCENISGLQLGSIEYIGDYAFYNCVGLSSVDFGERLKIIGEYAFYDCDGIERIEIPDTTIIIGNYAFYYCNGLKRLKLPVSTQYGFSTFAGFSDRGIPEIEELEFTFGDGTVFMPYDYCIGETESLRTVIFDDRITLLPQSFGCFPLLTTVKTNVSEEGVLFALPSQLQEIRPYAFENCSGLTGELVIPANVTSIGASSFEGCSGLTGELVIPANVTSIGASSFEGCSGLTGNLVMLEGMMRIGDYAFFDCVGLEALEIPDSTEMIGYSAFYNCSGLQRVKLPISTVYENSAFTNCTGIEEVEYTYGNGETYTPVSLQFRIGADSGLKTAIFDDRITELYAQMFDGYTQLTRVKTNESGEDVTFALPSQLHEIPGWLFRGCSCLSGEFMLPAGVAMIGDGAFYNCSKLTGDFAIPAGVTAIGNRAFYSCGGLTGNLEIPEGVTSIGDDAFAFCSGLTGSLRLSPTVTCIGRYAFRYCTGLTGNLVIPSSATSIGDYAFCGCSNLTGNLVIPETITSIVNGMFSGCRGLTGSLVLPEGITSIGDSAFCGCSSLTGDLVIPAGVVSIGDYAFQDCSGLEGTLVLPTNLTSIGEYAFRDCSGLTGDLVIPSGVVSIGDSAFYCCSSMTGELLISAGVTGLGNYVFYGCNGLTGSLVIPEGVTAIGEYAFAYCTGLAGNLVIPETVLSLGNFAFYECPAITSLSIMNRVCELYDDWGTIPQSIPIRGYENSTAQEYAVKYGNVFINLEATPCVLSCSEVVLTVGDIVTPAAWQNGNDITDFTLISSNSNVVEVDGNAMKMVGDGVATVKLITHKAEGTISITVKSQNTMVLPESLVSINEEAFAYVAAERIVVPRNAETIEARAFTENNSLQIIVIMGDNVVIKPMAFEGSNKFVILCHKDSSAAAFSESNGMQYLFLLD